MLGHHVYRIVYRLQPLGQGVWGIRKEGQATDRDSRTFQDEAIKIAKALAAADLPSRFDRRGRQS